MTQPELSLGEIERIVAGQHHDPHSVLGAHPGPDGVVDPGAPPAGHVGDGRARRRPQAPHDARAPGRVRGHGAGREGARLPDRRLRTPRRAGTCEAVRDDPYRYLPTLGEFDLYLIGEGRHEELWRVLGAHVREIGQATGTSFAVWAPNARGVRRHRRLQLLGRRARTRCARSAAPAYGSCSCPASADGARYKYAICGPDGVWREKADPMAALAERPPATASVVYHLAVRPGTTQDWMAARAERQPVREPMSIYEVHLGSWRPGPVLPRAGRRAGRLRHRPRLHPRGVPARRRAPVRRLLGLPGHLVLRADGAVRHARTTSATWSTRCTRPASA